MFFDLVILGVLFISAVFAFLRGFIREVLTILGVVGGLAAALAFGKELIPLMSDWIGVDPNAEPSQQFFDLIPYTLVATVLAYGSIFLICVIVLSIISNMLAKLARNVGLGAIDRTLGVIFGIARGVLVLAVLYLLPYLLFAEDTRKDWFKDSRLIVYIEQTSAWLAEFLPDTAKNTNSSNIGEKANDLTKATRDKLKDLDLLKDEDGPAKNRAAVSEPGYEREERQNLQELFEDTESPKMPAMPSFDTAPERASDPQNSDPHSGTATPNRPVRVNE